MSTYEVRISGKMPAGLLEQLGHVRTVQTAGTTLEVDVPDETALWGLIDALRSAGIDLLEVRRQSAGSPTTPG